MRGSHLFIALLSALAGGLIGSILTHYFARRREAEKLLREKGEALISTLYHHLHTLTTWRSNVARRVEHDPPNSLLLDLDLTYMLQRLYFPTLRNQLDAMEEALGHLVAWLENQDEPLEGRSQYGPEDGPHLYDAYQEACEAVVAAVVRAMPAVRASTNN